MRGSLIFGVRRLSQGCPQQFYNFTTLLTMLRLDLSLQSPVHNLALDEALLNQAEWGGEPVLRIWEFASPVVVLGRGSKINDEVDGEFCRRNRIAILRRCSGGAAIASTPGCVMYSVVLDLRRDLALRNIDLAHRYVMTRVMAAIAVQQPRIQWQGICDLTLDDKKCSGNSLRVARNHLLYHGTLLIDADLELIAGCLRTAPRQPTYRLGRDHGAFLTNVAIDQSAFADELAEQFGAMHRTADWPKAETALLAESKYATQEWTAPR